MKIKIEKNVPIPEKTVNKKRGRKNIFPFEDMKINDSFFVLSDNPEYRSITLSNAARNWAKRNGYKRKFKVDTEKNGCRIWRVK